MHGVKQVPCSALPMSAGTNRAQVGDQLVLKFRKYLRDSTKRMDQSFLRSSGKLQQVDCDEQQEGAKVVGEVRIPPAIHQERPAPGTWRQESSSRQGLIDSIKDSEEGVDPECIAIVSGLFSQEEDIRAYVRLGMVVRSSDGVQGTLRGPFGKTGKCKVAFVGRTSVQVGDRVHVA